MDTSFNIFPPQASEFAGPYDLLYYFETAVTVFFSALIFGLVIYFAIKYRRRETDQPTPTFESIRARIQASRGRPITLAVERNGHTVKLGPAKTIRSGDRWILGFVPGVAYRHYGAPTAFRYAGNDCWQAIKGMGLAIKGLFYKEGRDQLTSTVGIVRVGRDSQASACTAITYFFSECSAAFISRSDESLADFRCNTTVPRITPSDVTNSANGLNRLNSCILT